MSNKITQCLTLSLPDLSCHVIVLILIQFLTYLTYLFTRGLGKGNSRKSEHGPLRV